MVRVDSSPSASGSNAAKLWTPLVLVGVLILTPWMCQATSREGNLDLEGNFLLIIKSWVMLGHMNMVTMHPWHIEALIMLEEASVVVYALCSVQQRQ